MIALPSWWKWPAVFLLGLLVGFCGKPDPEPPPYAPPYIYPQPPVGGASATPPPVAAARSVSRARVVIERPIIPPGPSEGPQRAAGSPQPGPTPTPAMERITIEIDGETIASAPVVVVTPQPLLPPPPSPRPERLPLGVTVGVFPGGFALDWEWFAIAPGQILPLPGLEGVRLGFATVLNTEMVGAGGTLGLSSLHPRLYCEVGAYQAFSFPLEPRPYAGVGLRF